MKRRRQCHVGNETALPYPSPAAVRIWGVPFCERCAREQEAYFTVGEFTQELATDRTRRTRGYWNVLLSRTPGRMHPEPTDKHSPLRAPNPHRAEMARAVPEYRARRELRRPGKARRAERGRGRRLDEAACSKGHP